MDHVDILLLVGVAMEDDILHLDVVVRGDLEVGIVVVILVEDLGMEGVIRIVPDRGAEVLTGILGEIEEEGEGVRVIVVILVEVRLLLHVGEVELGVEALDRLDTSQLRYKSSRGLGRKALN